jgi:hypothetical protein
MNPQAPQETIAAAIAERNRLIRECEGLLWKVAARPGSIKLLQGIKNQLILFASYKANRSFERRDS